MGHRSGLCENSFRIRLPVLAYFVVSVFDLQFIKNSLQLETKPLRKESEKRI